MKPAHIFQHYIWIINTLSLHGRMTFEELKRKWVHDGVADGNPLSRTSFNRHRDAILSMFGIIIECEPKTYCYYISNPENLGDGSVGRWLYSTLAVHGVLADSTAINDRLVLESVPAGEAFLYTIIEAIKGNRQLRIGYQKFGAESYKKTVCPYALKLFRRRWYLLACTTENQMRLYALDRMYSVVMTDERFSMPADFSPQAYFSEYYGVLTVNEPMAHVVVRAYGNKPDYLRTLPLHHSQCELTSTPSYTDFSFDIRPTADFIGELLSHGDGIEVLRPDSLRQKMRKIIADNLKRY